MMYEKPEYRKYRCCMCPNTDDPENMVCPAGGPRNKPESPCRFVKRYKVGKSRIYFVRKADGRFKKYSTFYKTEKIAERWYESHLWRSTFDEAQAALNRLAEENRWEEEVTSC